MRWSVGGGWRLPGQVPKGKPCPFGDNGAVVSSTVPRLVIRPCLTRLLVDKCGDLLVVRAAPVRILRSGRRF